MEIAAALGKTLDDFAPAVSGQKPDVDLGKGEQKWPAELAATGSPEEHTAPVRLGDVAQATLTI